MKQAILDEKMDQSDARVLRHSISSALSAIDAAHKHLSGESRNKKLAEDTHRIGRQKLLDVLDYLDRISSKCANL